MRVPRGVTCRRGPRRVLRVAVWSRGAQCAPLGATSALRRAAQRARAENSPTACCQPRAKTARPGWIRALKGRHRALHAIRAVFGRHGVRWGCAAQCVRTASTRQRMVGLHVISAGPGKHHSPLHRPHRVRAARVRRATSAQQVARACAARQAAFRTRAAVITVRCVLRAGWQKPRHLSIAWPVLGA